MKIQVNLSLREQAILAQVLENLSGIAQAVSSESEDMASYWADKLVSRMDAMRVRQPEIGILYDKVHRATSVK